MEEARATKKTSSASVTTKGANIYGMLLGTDGVNDPAITVYDGIDNTGVEIIPTTTYDASALGLNGFMGPFKIRAHSGIYIEITCAGTVEVITFWMPI